MHDTVTHVIRCSRSLELQSLPPTLLPQPRLSVSDYLTTEA